MPELPEKFLKQLKKRLSVYSSLQLSMTNVKNYLNEQDLAFETTFTEQDVSSKNFNPFDIRDAFFEFVSSFMMKYKKFLVITHSYGGGLNTILCN